MGGSPPQQIPYYTRNDLSSATNANTKAQADLAKLKSGLQDPSPQLKRPQTAQDLKNKPTSHVLSMQSGQGGTFADRATRLRTLSYPYSSFSARSPLQQATTHAQNTQRYLEEVTNNLYPTEVAALAQEKATKAVNAATAAEERRALPGKQARAKGQTPTVLTSGLGLVGPASTSAATLQPLRSVLG